MYCQTNTLFLQNEAQSLDSCKDVFQKDFKIMHTFFWVGPDGYSVFHGGVDGQDHIGKVGYVQRNHPDVRPPREDEEAVHSCTGIILDQVNPQNN